MKRNASRRRRLHVTPPWVQGSRLSTVRLFQPVFRPSAPKRRLKFALLARPCGMRCNHRPHRPQELHISLRMERSRGSLLVRFSRRNRIRLRHPLQLLHLLLDLIHLLPVNLRLLVNVAQDEANIPGNRAQAEKFATTIQRTLGADRMHASPGIVMTDLERKSRIYDDLVLVALLNLRVDRDRQLARQMHDDVAGARLEVARAGVLRGSNKPRRNATCFRGSSDRAIDLGQIDIAAGGDEIGRSEHADYSDAAAARLRPHQSGCFTDFDFAAAGFRGQLAAGMLERDISAAGMEVRRSLHRPQTDVAAVGVERGIAGHRTDGDVTAVRAGEQFARHALGDDIAAAGFKPRRTSHIPCGDVSAVRRQGDATLDFAGINVAAAGGDIQTDAFWDRQLERYPEAAGRAVIGSLSFEVYAVGGVARRNGEALQELLRVFLRSFGLKMGAVVHSVGALCVNDDAAEIGGEVDAFARVRGHRASQVRGHARSGMAIVRFGRTAMRRSAGGEKQTGGQRDSKKFTEIFGESAPGSWGRHSDSQHQNFSRGPKSLIAAALCSRM